MNDPAFTTAAYILAEKTPKHLGKLTMPPQGWYLEGANLVVLLADGRKVRGPIADQKRDDLVWHASSRSPAKTVEKPLPSSKPSPSPRKKK